MAKVNRKESQVNARIVYWGIQGSGKSTNLRTVAAKMRSDHRGELREEPTRLDPTVGYEVLPISLGEVAGVATRIEILAPPGSREQAPTRKQLLDQVDGIVFVVDSQGSRIDENVESFDELVHALGAYGRSIEDMPFIVQYNKRDIADPLAVEDLHRKLQLGAVPVFECVATEGTGVLQTLSTISKRVIRSLREGGGDGSSQSGRITPTRVDAPIPSPPTSAERMEDALLQEAAAPEVDAVDASVRRSEAMLDAPWERVSDEVARSPGARVDAGLSIVSVGEATRAGERAVRVPIVLGDADGQTSSLVLTIQLDPLVEDPD